MKGLLAVLAMVMLSGCASFSPVEKFTEANNLIADANKDRLKEFANGMATCGNNAACQVALSMAFAGGLGQQQFFKPETAKDYLVAAMPYAVLGADLLRLFNGNGGSGQGVVVNGKGNTVIGVGNQARADRSSTLTANVDPYMPQTTLQQIRTTGTTGNVSGTMPPAEPVIVQ